MPILSRILVPVEFSSRCRGAAHYAKALACHFHSKITLIHVVAPPLGTWTSPGGFGYSGVGDLVADLVVEKTAELEAFAATELQGISVERIVVKGDPAHEIVACAYARDADLIAMPTHGYGPFRRLLLGSVTAKVLHDANCPVWTGPHLEQAPATESISFSKVLCAIDLGPDSRDVLAWAAAFARECGAELKISHVLPLSLVRSEGVYFDAAWRNEVAREASGQIDTLQQEMHAAGEVFIETGDVPATVADMAQQMNASLLVIGRGRHAGFLGRLRTNAYAILRESPCPVAAV